MDQITIQIFDNATSAYILKARLESEDITCFIQDEHMVTMAPFLNVATGGVKLKVWEKDVQKAQDIIQGINQQPRTDFDDKLIECPNCASTNFYNNFNSIKDWKGFISALSSLLLHIFPIYLKRVKKCKDCGTEFS